MHTIKTSAMDNVEVLEDLDKKFIPFKALLSV